MCVSLIVATIGNAIIEGRQGEQVAPATVEDVAEEEDVDLIIIAASGKSGLHRFFIGSVAEKVLKNSERDVLLIHN